jgi:hypothetical protein
MRGGELRQGRKADNLYPLPLEYSIGKLTNAHMACPWDRISPDYPVDSLKGEISV